MLSYGAAMFAITVFLQFHKALEKLVGENVLIYALFVIIGILVLATLWFYRTFRPTVTVIVGTIGWIATFVLLYAHYSQQTFK